MITSASAGKPLISLATVSASSRSLAWLSWLRLEWFHSIAAGWRLFLVRLLGLHFHPLWSALHQASWFVLQASGRWPLLRRFDLQGLLSGWLVGVLVHLLHPYHCLCRPCRHFCLAGLFVLLLPVPLADEFHPPPVTRKTRRSATTSPNAEARPGSADRGRRGPA